MATKLSISQMPTVEIVKKDLIIDVEIDDDKLGEFRMSKGSIDFYTKGAKKKHYRIGWKELAELITEHGTEKNRFRILLSKMSARRFVEPDIRHHPDSAPSGLSAAIQSVVRDRR